MKLKPKKKRSPRKRLLEALVKYFGKMPRREAKRKIQNLATMLEKERLRWN